MSTILANPIVVIETDPSNVNAQVVTVPTLTIGVALSIMVV